MNTNIPNAFKSNVNDQYNDNATMQSMTNNSTDQHTNTNHQNTDNDVIRVLINGQTTRFNANTINLSNKNTESISHSHSNVNEHEFSKSSHNNDKSPKHTNTNQFHNNISNLHDKTYESIQSKQQQQHQSKYSDDAMHLPDIVVGSTLLSANTGNRQPIPLSRSPPKIVVNDNTLDSLSSNEDETGTFSDSFDDSIELDQDVSELTDVSGLLFQIYISPNYLLQSI